MQLMLAYAVFQLVRNQGVECMLCLSGCGHGIYSNRAASVKEIIVSLYRDYIIF